MIFHFFNFFFSFSSNDFFEGKAYLLIAGLEDSPNDYFG